MNTVTPVETQDISSIPLTREFRDYILAETFSLVQASHHFLRAIFAFRGDGLQFPRFGAKRIPSLITRKTRGLKYVYLSLLLVVCLVFCDHLRSMIATRYWRHICQSRQKMYHSSPTNAPSSGAGTISCRVRKSFLLCLR